MEELCPKSELPQSVRVNGRFANPWPTWRKWTWCEAFKSLTEPNHSDIPNEEVLNQTLPILKPNFDFDESRISMSWIGHSTAVIHFDGITVLTDPIFSLRASMCQLIGPKRYRRAAATVDQLPHIDAVVISHNHYDHLDVGSVEALNARFGSHLYWLVPSGLKEWMKDVVGVTHNVIELEWWQSARIPSKPDIQFILTPAQHWTQRGLWDGMQVLWGSWTVVGPKHRFFFAGDTGYCPVFKQIGQMYGPFDLSAIPIGAYEPRWIMTPEHIDPEEAVQIHEDIRSKASVGIHWGTFVMAHEYYLEPPMKLKTALKDHNLDENEFIVISHGQTKSV
ncbi:unnamed protein product [Medioppia subpectinata]|uniref:N-acetylphosphatidylethanolamine-hydrolyzing phospholipase D n=1 Tax=Medioppia subpectinata TaxID=1979941 RepID=A0A7R9Q6Q2_9ACAR|nr:unnamed protein product [Medioppia subpectinata]CAG2114706.1 unnamed protein product [Medioppia subpectinata]